MIPTLRIARPTNDIEAALRFYRDGLGLELLGAFEGHEGFDGLMLGKPGAPWHLEFTREEGGTAPRSPGPESLLVLYLPDRAEYEGALARMRAHGFSPAPSHNPYWDRCGRTFEDFEGYRVVLCQRAWP